MRFTFFVFFALAILTSQSTASAQGVSVLFHGTQASPVGNAIVTLTPAAASGASAAARTHRELVIVNIGDSGDGVSLQMGGSMGGVIDWTGTATPLPTGGEFLWEVNAFGGITPCVRVQNTATAVLLTPDFSAMGSSTYRAEVWDDGNLVAAFTGLTGDMSAPQLPSGFGADLGLLQSGNLAAPYVPGGAVLSHWDDDVLITDVVSAQNATGDELRLFPENPTIPLTSVVSMDLLFVIPAALTPFTYEVHDAAQLMFGRMHRASDGAQIISSREAPTVASSSVRADHQDITLLLDTAELGSITLDMDPAESEDCVIWDIMDSGGNGGTDDVFVTGNLIAGGVGELLRVSSAHDGTQWNVTPDFSGSGATTVMIQLRDAGGNLVTEVASHSGAFQIVTTDYANVTGLHNRDIIALELRFPASVDVDIPGHGTFTASRVWMQANAPIAHTSFVTMTREFLSDAPGFYTITSEANALVYNNGSDDIEMISRGTAYTRGCNDCLVIANIGDTSDDGADFHPPDPIQPPDPVRPFGVQWYYPGTPAAQNGETDWCFTSRLQGEALPTDRMAIKLDSDGSQVNMTVDPRQSSTTEYSIVLKEAGVVKAQFTHTNLAAAFAQLADWPIGAGYRMLAYPDSPWMMYVDLGQSIDVTFPGGPAGANGSAIAPLTKADLIEVIAKNTAQPPEPVVEILLGVRFAGFVTFVFDKNKPSPTGIGQGLPAISSVLHPPFPNPFNPTTTLSFNLAQRGYTALRIYNVAGELVATLHEGELAAGPHQFNWQGINYKGDGVASGVYFVELTAPDGAMRTKVSLLK